MVLPMTVEALARNTLPFSMSSGCPQSISMHVGGHDDHDPDERHSMSSSPLGRNEGKVSLANEEDKRD